MNYLFINKKIKSDLISMVQKSSNWFSDPAKKQMINFIGVDV